MFRIGFCGVGNMAGAVLRAALSSRIILPEQIIAYNPTRSKLEEFAGITVASSNLEVCNNSDLVFLGFKPQMLEDICKDLKGKLEGKCVVSMLAGVSVDRLKEALGNVSAIRVMPNTPMVVGKGCTTIATSSAPTEVFELVTGIFSASGDVVLVEERDINRTIPLSSSSPAFFFRFVRAMCEAGVSNGMDYATSKELALSTMHGVVHLIENSNKSLDELIAQVTSPGGATLAGLTAFDDYKFEEMINEVFKRTINRAEELGR